jgi:hypothetical protein
VSKHYQTPQVDGNQELQVALLTRDLLNEGAANLPAHISNPVSYTHLTLPTN